MLLWGDKLKKDGKEIGVVAFMDEVEVMLDISFCISQPPEKLRASPFAGSTDRSMFIIEL